MAAQQLIIDIDDVNVTTENWNGIVESWPLNTDAPEDVSTPALKRAYLVTKLTAILNHAAKRGRESLAARAAAQAVPAVDLNA